jgi:hypothetical protein
LEEEEEIPDREDYNAEEKDEEKTDRSGRSLLK